MKIAYEIETNEGLKEVERVFDTTIDFAIDLTNLNVEIQRAAQLTREYDEVHAFVDNQVTRTKRAYEYTRDLASERIRKLSDEKLTEPRIKSLTNLEKDVQQAATVYDRATMMLVHIYNALRTMRERTQNLRTLQFAENQERKELTQGFN